MASTMASRLKLVGIVTVVIGGLVLPAPIAAVWRVLIAPLRATAGALPLTRLHAVEHAWAAWLAAHGYLPWASWPTVASQRDLLLAELLGTVLIASWLLAQVWQGRRSGGSGYGGPPVAGKGEHGTARWRAAAEMPASFGLWSADRPKDSNPSGIYVGQGPTPRSAWVLSSDQHALIVGSPGSFKTRGLVLESMGVIGSARRESMLVTDPKGELYAHTANWLHAQGYDVRRFDLREPSRSVRSNPVHAVTGALATGRRDQASALAWDIAHLLVGSRESHSNDPFWDDSAEALVAALILAVAQGDPPKGGRLPEGEEPWRWPRPEERHMPSVYATLLSGGAGGGRLDELIAQFPVDHPAAKAYGPVALSVEKTRASILGTAATALRLFGDDETAWLTAQQDHDLADIGRKPTAVFLVIPDERATRYPLATLYIQQTLQALASLADEHGGRLPVGVNFLLDEFGNLPQIRDFDKTVTVARGRGIRLALVLQDLAQLKRHYGEAANTIKGSLSTWIYLRTAEIDTAREIAAKLGQYTVAAENVSVPRVTWWTTNATVGTASTTHSLQARDLLTAEEVLRWPLGQALVLQAGQLPAKLPLPDLSAWARVWPEIQERTAQPEVQPVEAPPTWRPPQVDEGGAETGGGGQELAADEVRILAGDAEEPTLMTRQTARDVGF